MNWPFNQHQARVFFIRDGKFRYFSPELRFTSILLYVLHTTYQVRIHLNLSPCQPPRSQLHSNRLPPQQTNQPIIFLNRQGQPTCLWSFRRRRGRARERVGRRDDRWKRRSCDSQGVLNRSTFSLFSSLSLLPRTEPKDDHVLPWQIPCKIDWLLTNSSRSVDWTYWSTNSLERHSQPGEGR